MPKQFAVPSNPDKMAEARMSGPEADPRGGYCFSFIDPDSGQRLAARGYTTMTAANRAMDKTRQVIEQKIKAFHTKG